MSQESCEAAKPSCEQYEERKLLLRVDRHLVENWQKLPVSTLGATRVRVEEVSFLQRIWQQAKSALPCAVQQVQGPINPFPMCEMVEGVADRLTVPPLEDVLGWQDQRLHLQQILRDVRVELHRPVNGFNSSHFRHSKSTFSGDICAELVGYAASLQQGCSVADGGGLGQADVVVFRQHRLHVRIVAHLKSPSNVDHHVSVASVLGFHESVLVLQLLGAPVVRLGDAESFSKLGFCLGYIQRLLFL